eukprot:Blabericola_migrator_1__4853@NODE_2542_length_2627_cov_219_626563_g454_i2_p3_GENE_NODE_2542_length_2627_cov_219_626563_g454_i2NODE_2542_length_2627_cov_219_626563_g454_i2_p3_ORF_typecomplete_len151_score7_51DUF667/PF05018_13/0_023_NODE_2542_length_2627_cov_219_626563_g454_i217442196
MGFTRMFLVSCREWVGLKTGCRVDYGLVSNILVLFVGLGIGCLYTIFHQLIHAVSRRLRMSNVGKSPRVTTTSYALQIVTTSTLVESMMWPIAALPVSFFQREATSSTSFVHLVPNSIGVNVGGDHCSRHKPASFWNGIDLHGTDNVYAV